MESIDWDKYRSLFDITKTTSYFMAAGAGAISKPVLKALTSRYQSVAQKGGYAFGENLAIMESCREKIATLINAEKENIAFIPNVSFGMNALAHSIKKQKKVITAQGEFPSSILPWKNINTPLTVIPDAPDLQTNLIESLKDTPQNEESIVLSSVNFANGYKVSIDTLIPYVKNRNLIINHTQGITVNPINVKKQKIHALVASCYKWMFCGEGLSFLYISPEFFHKLTPAFIGWRSLKEPMSFKNNLSLHEDARVFELGWDNMTSFAGYSAALNLLHEIGLTNIEKRTLLLTSTLIELLKVHAIPIISNTNSDHLSGIVLIGPFEDPESIAETLYQKNIFVNVRANGIRISISFFNNLDDINKLIVALAEILISNESQKMLKDKIES